MRRNPTFAALTDDRSLDVRYCRMLDPRRYITMAKMLASSRFSRENGWTISCGGSRIALENSIDFLTVYDFHVDRHYQFLAERKIPGSVLWDIGANIGAVSLMFAGKSWINRVYAYEPFPETLQLALRSCRLNPDASEKIVLKPLGLSGQAGRQTIAYTGKAKCAIGISEIPSQLKAIGRIRPTDLRNVDIELADAASELEMIRRDNPNSPILLKLDAEGAEYAIIERLSEAGLLREIEASVIEWHGSPGAAFLEPLLSDAGFTTSTHPLNLDGSIGLTVASRI